MEKERQKEIETEFEPTRWIVPELRESPTSMTLYPRVTVEDIDLALVDNLPKPKLFQVDKIEIADN